PQSLLLLLITLRNFLVCLMCPYKPCRRSGGTPKRRAPIGRALRLCRHCRGTGLRLRLGRRAFNHLRRHRTTTASRYAAKDTR
ncbi:MAG: hypothetical protein ACRDTC_03810, partial [Pseudonocardiaceae bacterium]